MKAVAQWLFVLSVCGVSAYYLNWISYVPAAAQDGSLKAALRLATKWYGVPLGAVVQVAIWWAMPTLFKLAPSPWIAIAMWPLMSTICKTVIMWRIRAPERSDWIVVIGYFVIVVLSWLGKVIK